jgi:hypothetical protein
MKRIDNSITQYMDSLKSTSKLVQKRFLKKRRTVEELPSVAPPSDYAMDMGQVRSTIRLDNLGLEMQSRPSIARSLHHSKETKSDNRRSLSSQRHPSRE